MENKEVTNVEEKLNDENTVKLSNKLVFNVVFSWPQNTWKSTSIENLAKKLESKWYTVELYKEIAREKLDIREKEWQLKFQEEVYDAEQERFIKLMKEKESSNMIILTSVEKKKAEWEQALMQFLTEKAIWKLWPSFVKINLIDRTLIDNMVYYNFNKMNWKWVSEKLEDTLLFSCYTILNKVYDYKVLYKLPIKDSETMKEYNDEKLNKMFEKVFNFIKETSWENTYEMLEKQWQLPQWASKRLWWNLLLDNSIEFEEKNYDDMIINMIEETTVWDILLKSQ